MAFFYSASKAFEMLPFTTQKYQKQFLNLTTEEMCLKNSMQLHPNLISKLFLNDINYNEKTRSDIEKLVELVKDSFEKLLDANKWMDPVTKKIAKEKLLAIQSNVAAPDIVFDDQSLEKDNAQVSCYILNCVFNFYLYSVW